MRAIYLGNYFVAGCIAFSLRRVDSEFASGRISGYSRDTCKIGRNIKKRNK
jgi:hypothetical protein